MPLEQIAALAGDSAAAGLARSEDHAVGADASALGSTIDVGRVLDEAPWLTFQKGVLFLASLAIVLDGIDTQTLTLAIPKIARGWNLGLRPFGIVIAAGSIAMVIGTLLGGMVGDRLGRRVALLGSTVICGAGTLAAVLAHDVFTLGITRVVASIGIGAAMPNATALVAEYTPRRYRSLAISIALGSVPIGAFVGGVLASVILPRGNWQALFLVCGVIPMIGAALLAVTLPESIRFLLGRPSASPRIGVLLGKLGQRVGTGDSFIDSVEEHLSKASIRELFARRYRQDTLSISAAFFLMIFSTLFIASWTPSLLARLGHAANITSAGAAAFSIGGLIGALCGAALFTRIGWRAALLIMTGGAVLTTLVLSMSPLGPGAVADTTLMGAFLVTGIFVPGSQVLLFTLAGQIYPTSIRATGVGFVAAVGRIGAVLSGLVGPLLLSYGVRGFFIAVATAMLMSGMLVQLARAQIPRPWADRAVRAD